MLLTALIAVLLAGLFLKQERSEGSDRPTGSLTSTIPTEPSSGRSSTAQTQQYRRDVNIDLDMAQKPPQRAFDVDGWRQIRLAESDFWVGCTPNGDERRCHSPVTLIISASASASYVSRAADSENTAVDDPRVCSAATYGDGYLSMEVGHKYCVKTPDHLIVVSVKAIPPLSAAITVPLEIVVWPRN